MFTLKLNDPKILNNTIGTISEFISDATFQITNEGLKLVAMDPANVAMVVFKLLSRVFKVVSKWFKLLSKLVYLI